jgi:uncharacterized protein (TIGR02453 family)
VVAVAGSPYFTKRTFQFLKDLAANNERTWFQENKERYEDDVKIPALRFIEDFAPRLSEVSAHFHAGPKALYRIHRDTRFSKDKRPYKTHTGIHFRHDRIRDAHAPGFYLHLEPGQCFLGLGVWRPDGPTTRRIREAIAEDADGWTAAVDEPAFASTFERGGDRLTRPPRGFDPEHPLVEELKWKDFIASRPLDQASLTSAELPDEVAGLFHTGAPFMAFLCNAVGVAY